MEKKLTPAQLRMAALGNNMMEAGSEFYREPEVRKEIKKNLKEKKTE